MFPSHPMADDDTRLEEQVAADAEWNDSAPTEAQKLAIFSERKKLAEEFQKTWFWHLEVAYEYRESSQIPPELRDLGDDVLYWCLNICRDTLLNIVGSLTASEPTPIWSGKGFEDETGGKAVRDVTLFTLNNKKTTNFKVINGLATADMVTCGVGAIEEYYDEDALVHIGPKKVMFGDVAARRLNPRKLLFDPSRRLKDIHSPKWMIYLDEGIDLRWLLQKFGEKASGIKGKRVARTESLITSRSSKEFGDEKGQSVSGDQETQGGSASAWTRVAEVERHYYEVSEPVKIVYRRTESPPPPPTVTPVVPGGESPDAGAMPDVPSSPVADEETAAEDEITGWTPVDYGPEDIPPEEKDAHHVVTRIRNRVRLALVCEGKLLGDKELKFDTIPIALYLGEEIQGFHLSVGIMYHIRHPQDLVNSLISAVGENALLTNNPWTIYDESGLAPKMKQRIEDHGSGPGLKIEVTPGRLHDAVKRDSPPQISQGILTLWQEVLRLFDRIAGRYDVQFGRPPYDMSGRGLIASQQAADLSSTGWVQGMVGGMERAGMLRFQNIQKNYVYGRALRITDEFGTATVLHLKKSPQGMAVVTKDGQTLLPDLSTAEFDLEMKVEPGAMDSPDLKMKKGQVLFEAGVYSKKRLAEAYGEKHPDKLVEEREKEDQQMALGKVAMEAIQKDPEVQTIIQNPQILQGLEQDAAAYKALVESDPRLEPFLKNPPLLQRLISDAVAHRNGSGAVSQPPPVGAGV